MCVQMFSVVITLESGILPAIPTSFVAEVAPLLKKHHDEAVSKYPKVCRNGVLCIITIVTCVLLSSSMYRGYDIGLSQ